MLEAFVPKRFTGSSLRTIERAVTIIAEMREEGYTLTLRQLYYQFVTRNWLPNKHQSYKNLGSLINDARLAGMIDWDDIQDRTRWLNHVEDWPTPQDFILEQGKRYAEDLTANQPIYQEVWIEKDALIGVVERPCNKWRIPYYSTRGYGSQSEMYEASKRLSSQASGREDRCIVWHLSDHDPSGLDMTEDLIKRFNVFEVDCDVEVRRLALTYEQIKAYNPPPNPLKETDSRHVGYKTQFGVESWELDSLRPSVIAGLVDEALQLNIDVELFERDQAAEAANRARLLTVGMHFNAAHCFIATGHRVIE